jgi:hypothetical protein
MHNMGQLRGAMQRGQVTMTASCERWIVVAAVCGGIAFFVLAISAVRLAPILEQERRAVEERRTHYTVQLETLVRGGANAGEVAQLLGRESRMTKSEAAERIRRHAPSDIGLNSSLAKVERWPLASFFTDGDFTFVVFFDAEGRATDFVIGHQ